MMRKSVCRLVLVILVLLTSGASRAEEAVKITRDLVYGHKDGMALTVDVLSPAKPNGACMLFINSAGWYSVWRDPAGIQVAVQPYLTRGFTVVVVRHGSAPRYTVPDAVEDVRRCVRVIRMHAKEFGFDPERIGAFGGSAGGHLSLMLATTGDDGDPKSKDEVLRQSSRIAAAVALCPPTDLRTWVTNPPEAIKKTVVLTPPLTFPPAKAPDCSPVLHVTDKTAPTLLIHGDKDELVPIEHSQNMLQALEAAHVSCKLVVIKGEGHGGFSAAQNQRTVLPELIGWFEKHLVANSSTRETPER